jgi:hypothetical protein
MSSNPKTFWLIWFMCAALPACREPAGAPLPLLADVAGGPAEQSSFGPTESSPLSGSGGKASGYADVHGTPVQNVKDETYSFTAVWTDAPPLAKGQVEVHLLRFTGQEVSVHAEVTCLSIVGNDAWVGSRVRRYVLDRQEIPERAGWPMIFRVRDLGEGEGAIDLASLVFFFPGGDGDLGYCNTIPDFPILRESSAGNIQVKP